ncbi:MAG TPA: hypothetical protein VKW06_16405 [Candidatus Angelobacter sp.]|nr:hypothetical protein [Candidatus Angelobacter sp.]
MIIVLGIVAAIAVVFVLFWRGTKARMQRVIALGQELGLSPVAEIPLHFGTKLFKQGYKSDFHQPALEGTINGRRLLAFDYTYSSGADENALTYFWIVVAYALPEQNLPSFGLQKRSLLKHGIAIEGNLDFAKRFCVSGEDPAAIRSLFSPSLVSFFTSTELDKQKFMLEGAGNWLVFYGRTLRAEHYRSFLEQTSQIASGFCSHMGSLNSERPIAIAAGDAH